MNTSCLRSNLPRQRGAALIVSLMMLVAITLVGVAVMSNSRLEWLMANNNALQTSTYPQTEAALLAAEADIRGNICNPAIAFPNDCSPTNINWAALPYYYSSPTAAPGPSPDITTFGPFVIPNRPLPGDPRTINGWNGTFNWRNVTTGGINSRYVIRYLGCVYLPGAGIGTGCGDRTTPAPNATASAFTFEIWVLTQDTKGVARLVQATYVMMDNWTTNNIALTSALDNDAPVRPTSLANPQRHFRRIGQVE